jgi:hypothetical protein
MMAIIRLYQDSYGNNMGARTFCQLQKYFGGVLITDNKKIKSLEGFQTLSYGEAAKNADKFNKVMVYNTKPNMFGGVPADHMNDAIKLIMKAKELYYYNCDPILHLPKGVAESHEIACPGLSECVRKLNMEATILSRKNTDFTKYMAANIQRPIIEGVEKEFTTCYFGNSRQGEREKQVLQLLSPLKSLIIGHEHEKFAWFSYTPDFYSLLSMAWTTPIIGDKELHYETGIPSLRLYEAWHSTAITLVDSRFNEPLLDSRFFFKDAEEFHNKSNQLATDKELYNGMLKVQRLALKKMKKKFDGIQFNWGTLKKSKEKVLDARRLEIKERKQEIITAAKKRLNKRKNEK